MDEFPNLFEHIVTGQSSFHMNKRLIFPGKGEAEVQTLILTSRGPVFIFPRRLSQFDEETELPDANELIRRCHAEFLRMFPNRSVVRAGKVNKYVFASDETPATRIIAERFLKLPNEQFNEVNLTVNLATDEFNRRITLGAVRGIRKESQNSDAPGKNVHGVSVEVDFNNKDMSHTLHRDRISSILHQADSYNADELYKFLNCAD